MLICVVLIEKYNILTIEILMNEIKLHANFNEKEIFNLANNLFKLYKILKRKHDLLFKIKRD